MRRPKSSEITFLVPLLRRASSTFFVRLSRRFDADRFLALYHSPASLFSPFYLFFLQLLFVAVVFFLFILVERWIRDKSSLGAGDSFPLFVTLLFQRMVEFSETEYFGQVGGGTFFLQPVC